MYNDAYKLQPIKFDHIAKTSQILNFQFILFYYSLKLFIIWGLTGGLYNCMFLSNSCIFQRLF